MSTVAAVISSLTPSPRERAPQRGRRLPAAALVVALTALGLAFAVLSPAEAQETRATSEAEEFARLPLPARATVSGVLGRDDRSYRVLATDGGFRATNARHRLDLRFNPESVSVRAGAARLDLAVRAWGYEDGMRPLPQVEPRARANRVEYPRGPLTEWYVNGPLGLQQGFTLAAPPAAGREGGLVTLAVELTGGLQPKLDSTAGGLSLGDSSLRYQGLFAVDALGRELPARFRLHGSTVLVQVEDAGARYPVTIDPFVQQAKLNASDGAAGDQLGFSVAVSDGIVVAGAPFDAVGENNQGSVYVFQRAASGWATTTERAKLTASDGTAGDHLGSSVAVSGNTIVAGAPSDFVNGNGNQGSLYVFQKPGSGWASGTERAKLTASDGTAGDQLGFSVGVSGNIVVAGAPFDFVNGNGNQGSLYVFQKPGSGWANATERAKLTASDGGPGDQLGYSVAVSGNFVVAGANQEAVSENFQGAVYVFQRPGSGWASGTERAKLTASDGTAGDQLGFSVGVSGNIVVAGAPFDFVNGNGNQGSAYVFRWAG